MSRMRIGRVNPPAAFAGVLALALAGCGSPGAPTPGTAAAPEPTASTDARRGTPGAAQIERLLTHSRVESIVDSRAGAFTRQVALLAGDLTDPELERLVPAVQAAFAPDLLRSDIASYMRREAPADGTVDEVLGWLDSGASAEMRALTDAYEPEGTVEDYIRERISDPPSEERVEQVASWAEVQGAGEFYVLLDEALNEAAHEVWAAFRPDAPAYEPLDGDLLNARLNASFNASVVSTLRDFETVPDSVLEAATAEYATDEGQWYVRTYSLGVASAIRAAGERTVLALGRSQD